MDQNKIIEVLTSKPHNIHYLNRYVKFIQYCRDSNKESQEDYFETHHICPKASDLFPDYDDKNKYPWNFVSLTFRQHLMSHVMLWKIYGGSQAIALDCMLGKFNGSNNKTCLERRIVPPSFLIRYLERVKLESNKVRALSHIGKSTYLDSDGNKYYIDTNDPFIKEMNLINIKTGQKQSQETIDMISETKRKSPNRTIKMYFLNYKRKVKINTSEFDEHLSQGWTTKLTKDDKIYVRILRDKAAGKKQRNKKLFALPDGTFYGKLDKNDPLIKEKHLIPYVTDKMKQQRKTSFQEGAQRANTGSEIYNNGLEEKKFKTDPGEGWTKGRLPRNDSHSINHTKAMKERMGGSTYWTNGNINIRLPKGQLPDGPEWRRGFVRKKK